MKLRKKSCRARKKNRAKNKSFFFEHEVLHDFFRDFEPWFKLQLSELRYLSETFFKVDDVDTLSEQLPQQNGGNQKRNSIFHQPGSEWSRGKRVSISYTTQQADVDSPHRPRKVRIIFLIMYYTV